MSMKDVFVTIRGNATKDAHYTAARNDPSVVVRIAVNRRYYDREADQYKDVKTTDYYNVYGTKALGKHMLECVHKGDPILATGRLNYSEWTREDGTEGHSMTIRAESLGHDMTFGATSIRRSGRAEETPPIDTVSGEITDDGFSLLGGSSRDEDSDGDDGLPPSGATRYAGPLVEDDDDDAGDDVGDGDDRELATQGSVSAPF